MQEIDLTHLVSLPQSCWIISVYGPKNIDFSIIQRKESEIVRELDINTEFLAVHLYKTKEDCVEVCAELSKEFTPMYFHPVEDSYR